MGIKTILLSMFVCILIGMGIGYGFHSLYICPDQNKAIVKQLERDAEKLTEVKKEVQIKYVYRDKIKTVIKAASPSDCLDSPFPDSIASGLRHAFEPERP